MKIALNMYPNNDVSIIRIGDTMNDKLRIPREYEKKIVGQEKYCTLPELEILLIIGEGLYKDFLKVKSAVKAKDFAKMNIKYQGHKYDNRSYFYECYFSNRPDFLVQVIKEYKKKHGSHKKDQLYLADLLK